MHGHRLQAARRQGVPLLVAGRPRRRLGDRCPWSRSNGGSSGCPAGLRTPSAGGLAQTLGATRSANAQPRSPPRGPEAAARGVRDRPRLGSWRRRQKLSPAEDSRKGCPSGEQSRHQRPGGAGVVSSASAPLRVPSTGHPLYAEVSERQGLWSEPDPAQRVSRTRAGQLERRSPAETDRQSAAPQTVDATAPATSAARRGLALGAHAGSSAWGPPHGPCLFGSLTSKGPTGAQELLLGDRLPREQVGSTVRISPGPGQVSRQQGGWPPWGERKENPRGFLGRRSRHPAQPAPGPL